MAGQDVSSPELGLRDYLRSIRRRKGIIALTVVLTTAAALVYSLLQTPVYAGRAEVLLQPRITESLFDPGSGQRIDAARAVQTEIRVLRSEEVRAAVRDQIGFAPAVSAKPLGQTDVIEVSAENTDGKRAAAIANAYATAYIDFRRQQAVDDLLAAGQKIQSKILDLQKEIDQSGGPQKEALFQQQALFKTKLDQLQVDAALKTGSAQLVTRASAPTEPVRPRPVRSGMLAVGFGLVLGIALAFAVDHLDDSVNSKEDLERATLDVDVLGLIPAIPGWKPGDEPRVVSITEPTSPAAEAYRALRTSVQFLGLDRPVQSLQLTSPNAQEGKTTTLANLGVALARTGRRVILVCCDLRRPRIHEFFGLSNTVGFTTVLLGEVGIRDALQGVPGVERLQLLASGPLPPNPSELLSSRRVAEVLSSLQADGHLVLIDSPPVLPVTDALLLSKRVDATLLVCVAGGTTRKEAERAAELLRQVDAPLVGTVLNGVTSEGAYGYYNYRYAGRYESAPQVQKPSRK